MMDFNRWCRQGSQVKVPDTLTFDFQRGRTRLISSREVSPASTFATPFCQRVCMPWLMASYVTWSRWTPGAIRSRISSVIVMTSNIPVRSR